MSDFISQISAIGAEFKEMFTGIPGRFSTILSNLPIAAVGILVVMFELAIIAVSIFLISKVVRTFVKKEDSDSAESSASSAPAAVPAPAPVPAPAAAPAAPSGIELSGVDEPTAAVIMALVSNKSGIPLSNLRFRSIKKVLELTDVEEPEAAVIMALVSHESGIPLERLSFKSIKKVEDK